jgi:hypothetical protein
MRRNGKRLEMEQYYFNLSSSTFKVMGTLSKVPIIKKVIFNPPATIVLWGDGTKTVVKCQEDDPYDKWWSEKLGRPSLYYDPEKGLAMCIAKKALGNKGNYYNEFKKWLEDNGNDKNTD